MPNINDLKTVAPDSTIPTNARKWRPKNEPLVPTRSASQSSNPDLDQQLNEQSLLETTPLQPSSIETTKNETTNPNLSLNDDRPEPTNTKTEEQLSKQSLLKTTLSKTTSLETALLQPSSIDTTKNETTNPNLSLNDDRPEPAGSNKPLPAAATSLKYGGYIPIKCTLFSPEVFTLLGPIEFKLFTYLTFLKWRYPEKSGYVRAALPYLAKGTKIARSAVFNHLKTLIELNLITCIEVNQKFGNLYKVSDIGLWTVIDQTKLEKEKQSLQETTPIQTTATQTTTVRIRDYNSPRGGSQQSVLETKDLSSLSSSTYLSLSQFLKSQQLAELEARWLSFLKKEREREEKGLLKLFEQKPDEAETILKAFQIILKEQDEYGEIKSAISVLETNYTGQYRTKALAAMNRQQQKDKENHVKTEAKHNHAETEDAEAQAQLVRMRCFETAFPDLATRKQFIATTCRGNSMFATLGINSPITTAYAVNEWAQGEGSRAVLTALNAASSEATH